MRVAYLASQYPAPSHTFIAREIEALRRRGVAIETFTIRACPATQLRRDEDRSEAVATTPLVGTGFASVLLAQAFFCLRSPLLYLRGLRDALRFRMPGARNALWALFHFVEAVVLARHVKLRGLEHLHCHFANAASQVGMLAARLARIPWSITLHGSACFDSALRPLLRHKIADCRFVCCVSDFGRAQAKRASDPSHWNKIQLVRCGLALGDLPLQPPSQRSRLRVISVGRLVAEKGHVDLLEAFAAVVDAGVDAELRILGEGNLRPVLEATIRERELGDRVTLVGMVPVEEVLTEVSRSDVFALSSLMEGLPVVLMEAMAVGTAVVAPRITGIPELVEDEVTGLLYTAARPDLLARQLQRLLEDPDLRQRCITNGRRKIEQEFDIDVAVAPLAQRFLPH